jgi:hypothetical protein
MRPVLFCVQPELSPAGKLWEIMGEHLRVDLGVVMELYYIHQQLRTS